jgi:hypothetical protein
MPALKPALPVKPTPPQKTTTPAKPTPPVKPATTAPGLDLDALGASLSKGHPKPPAKPATKPVAAPKPGGAPKSAAAESLPASALAGLADKVGQLWTLNCDIPGTREVVAKVQFTLSSDGRVIDGPTLLTQSGGAVFAGAAEAAVRAIKAGQPYSLTEASPEARNKPITMRFLAKDACENR